jgi:rRNA small subunit pseudouridine methyltransferase Nep1
MPLTLILAECGLELIPEEIKHYPAIQKNINSQSYASKLLDNALHHAPMSKLKDVTKRGRPDITHTCLLNALGSPLNKSGNLKIYIHTIKNKLFEINPDIKIARNYNRFKGLMAKLLLEDEIKTEKIGLISRVKESLSDLLKPINREQILLFSSKGTLVKNHFDLFDRNLNKNYVAIVGCFQKGFYSEEILTLSDKIISISRFPLDAWVALNKITSYYELSNDIF